MTLKVGASPILRGVLFDDLNTPNALTGSRAGPAQGQTTASRRSRRRAVGVMVAA